MCTQQYLNTWIIDIFSTFIFQLPILKFFSLTLLEILELGSILHLTRGTLVVLLLDQLKNELCKCSWAWLVPSAEHAHRDASNNILNSLACAHHLNWSVFQPSTASADIGGTCGYVCVDAACVRLRVWMRASCVDMCCSVCALMELGGSKRGRICWSGKLARIEWGISELWGRIWFPNTDKPVRTLVLLAGNEALCDNCCYALLGTRCSGLDTYHFNSPSVNNNFTKQAGFLYLLMFFSWIEIWRF